MIEIKHRTMNVQDRMTTLISKPLGREFRIECLGFERLDPQLWNSVNLMMVYELTQKAQMK